MATEPDLRPAAGYRCRVLLTSAAEAALAGSIPEEVRLPVAPYVGLAVGSLLGADQIDLMVSAACRCSADRHLVTLDLRNPTPGEPT